ncbi:MAG: DUF4936 family protein [Leptothrix sp. (in: b-proteobacteria)]
MSKVAPESVETGDGVPAAAQPGLGAELFVYYRVAPADEAAAQAHLASLQNQLRAALPGLQARLLRRGADPGASAEAVVPTSPSASPSSSPSTWMETYRHPHGLSAAQLAQICQALADAPPQRIGARHEECFTPLGTDNAEATASALTAGASSAGPG